ncbi:hypothetical protein GCM10027269_64440 [Kribbella endophytica]
MGRLLTSGGMVPGGFEGFEALVELVRLRFRRLRKRLGREDTPPILACVQPSLHEQPGLLVGIAEQLRPGDRREKPVPYAYVDLSGNRSAQAGPDHDLAPIDVDDVVELRKVLSAITGQLALGNGGQVPVSAVLSCQLVDEDLRAGAGWWAAGDQREDVPAGTGDGGG